MKKNKSIPLMVDRLLLKEMAECVVNCGMDDNEAYLYMLAVTVEYTEELIKKGK